MNKTIRTLVSGLLAVLSLNVESTVYSVDKSTLIFPQLKKIAPYNIPWYWTADGNVLSTTVDENTFYYGDEANFVTALKYADDPATRWTFETDGAVSSLLLLEGSLFAGSADGYLYSFDKETGLKQWDFYAGGAVSMLSASDDTLVMRAYADGISSVVALDLTTKKEKWRFSIQPSEDKVDVSRVSTELKQTAKNYNLLKSHSLSQLEVYDGKVFFSTTDWMDFVQDEATMTALDLSNGHLVWTIKDAGDFGFHKNMILAHTGNKKVIVGYDINTGKAIGRRFSDRWESEIKSRPTVVDGKLYFATNQCQMAKFDIQSGSLHWFSHTCATQIGVVDGEIFYTHDKGHWGMVSVEDGTEYWGKHKDNLSFSDDVAAYEENIFAVSGGRYINYLKPKGDK